MNNQYSVKLINFSADENVHNAIVSDAEGKKIADVRIEFSDDNKRKISVEDDNSAAPKTIVLALDVIFDLIDTHFDDNCACETEASFNV